MGEYVAKLSRLLGITDVDLHIEEVTGADKSLDVVVDIFNRVNSGGTKLSKGDLALAKICADWPEGRDAMKEKLVEWTRADYHFTLDWLLRSVNTVLTGEAKFQYLHEKTADEVKDALALFEVLSLSDTRADQAWRRRVYASVPNCQHYGTVSLEAVEVVAFDRSSNWQARALMQLDQALELPALGVAIPLADMYRWTPLGGEGAPGPQ